MTAMAELSRRGARSPLWASHMGGGAQGYQSSSTGSPGKKQTNQQGTELEAPGLEPVLVWDAGAVAKAWSYTKAVVPIANS